VLLLAGIFGARPKSGKEVIVATPRALQQQALERWKLQKEAQIEQMMRDGIPLGAVAAALASPETAERIALMETATSGNMSALDAARQNLLRAGQQTSVLDTLAGAAIVQRKRRGMAPVVAEQVDADAKDVGDEEDAIRLPLVVTRRAELRCRNSRRRGRCWRCNSSRPDSRPCAV